MTQPDEVRNLVDEYLKRTYPGPQSNPAAATEPKTAPTRSEEVLSQYLERTYRGSCAQAAGAVK